MPDKFKYVLSREGKMIAVCDNELYHHGIKGQKWGVRRYQNADGTLTEAGRKREARREHRKEYGFVSGTLKTSREMTRKTDRKQSVSDKGAEIKRNMKEAADRIDFYGGKRAAKDAVTREASYVKAQNRGRAYIKSAISGVAGAATIAAGTAIEAAPLAIVGMSGGIVGIGAATIATVAANRYITKHANTQIAYIADSSHGHDYVVSQDDRQRRSN